MKTRILLELNKLANILSKTNKTSRNSRIIFFFIISFIIMFIYNVFSPRDNALEEEFYKKVNQLNAEKTPSIDVGYFISEPWDMVCIQFPYQHKKSFEALAMRDVYGYQYIESDSNYIVWVFYKSKMTKWFKVDYQNTKLTWNYEKIERCIYSNENPMIYFDWSSSDLHSNNKFFFIKKQGVK